eukprot:1552262-Amphidinium_carterae.1
MCTRRNPELGGEREPVFRRSLNDPLRDGKSWTHSEWATPLHIKTTHTHEYRFFTLLVNESLENPPGALVMVSYYR